jgi:cobalamin synthase
VPWVGNRVPGYTVDGEDTPNQGGKVVSIIGLVVGLILALIVYYVLAMFLPAILAGLVALLVLLACVFGGVGDRVRL